MKKYLSFVLVLLLLMSMLTGCSLLPGDTAEAGDTLIFDEDVPLASSPYTTPSPSPTPNLISSQEALDLALGHAEISAADAEAPSIILNTESYRPEYVVEFSAAGKNYWFKIHGYTGEILAYVGL